MSKPEQAGLHQPIPADGYAGDISPQLAFHWFENQQAVLVDIRSDAEREWVGFVPGATAVAWKQWPGMAMNPDFDQAIVAAANTANTANAPSAAHAAHPDKVSGGFNPQKLMLLCRSGVRSIAAAKRATELGLEAYNILEGFEGDANDSGHRGFKGGWRTRGLPWRQN
jgi:sulfur dioxygenase